MANQRPRPGAGTPTAQRQAMAESHCVAAWMARIGGSAQAACNTSAPIAAAPCQAMSATTPSPPAAKASVPQGMARMRV